ncbi:ABC transporter substrate-binding protein [Anaerocolumna xylanovorans]|uniref:Raffinose/stachyose/melibiose transport system substrate-binding protein n=1 Tax=Anaerocolumna xylanovorans DSM 12503 TaxID=1121345 RepID=A0A1M7YHK0_9FIRM|nr:ABC transporter substrate-binding protein [Anaerocolumna xylanovorans]SHO52073.1 raffinose/stachyose/melibiose transport system substrate-binding protein [Anaerocolumna xylanovorans DSM 12503]
MKKKLISALLCATMVASLLTGCGAKSTSNDTKKDGTAVTQAASDNGGKSIVYWSMWEATEPQAKVIKEAVDAYMKNTGNKVDLQFKGRTGIREGLQPALDAGTAIDLFDEDLDRVNGTWGGYLLDLETLAKDADFEATANAGLIAACRTAGGGTLKSIPYQPNVFAFFYNQSLFDKAGIKEVPKTWDEFLKVCETLKGAGITPLTSDDAYINTNLGYHLSRLVGEERTQQVVKEGLWAEEPAVLKAAQAYEELAKKGYMSKSIESNVWPNGQNVELALGEVAMYLNGSWLPNEVKDMTGPDFKWGCFSYPALDGGVTGTEAANFGAQVLAINKNTQVSKEAFELITYITKGEFDAKLSEESIGIPADTTNKEWPAALSAVKPVLDSLKTRYTWAGGIEANADMTPVIKENMLKLCGGSITAQQFVDNLEAASK